MNSNQKIPEIDPILIEPNSRDDRKVQLEELRLREIWRSYGDASKPFDRSEATKLNFRILKIQETKRRRANQELKKEKQQDLKDRHDATREHIAKNKHISYVIVDENGVLIELKYHDQASFTKRNNLGEIEYTINPKIGDIIDSLIPALDNLPDVRKNRAAFDKAFFEKYNDKTVHFLYPNDGKSPSHLYPIMFKWRP